MSEALKLTLGGSAWARRRDRLGYVGAIRATEITWGERNGWHPHCHAVLLFERPLSGPERLDLEHWLTGRWGAVLTSRGLGTITAEHGVDVRSVTAPGALSDYLTKVEGGWSAGLELTRSDLKGRAPVELLREFAGTGERRWLTLWLEYESATFGRRAIRWTPGLRARLLGIEAETSDVDLAASEGVDLALIRAVVGPDRWREHLRDGSTGRLLTEVEQAASVLLWMADAVGLDVEPIGLPRSEVTSDVGSC